MKKKEVEVKGLLYVEMRREAERMMRKGKLTRQFTFADNEELNQKDPGNLNYQNHVEFSFKIVAGLLLGERVHFRF